MADASETGACRMWLDCDPGHDDAMALLLACYSDGVELLGVSAVAGNQTVQKTTRNALRVLHAAGRPDVRVWAGATKPLLRPPFNCPEIHGESGLCGAELSEPDKDAEPGHAIIAMEAAITRAYEQSGGEPVQLVATGMLTNVALLLSVYPHVAPMVDVSIMGGAHTGGNTGVTQEFNIQCDPEAAKVVFDAPVRSLFMVPLEVTHTALATPSVLRQLHGGADEPKTPFRKAVHDLLLFFADTYQTVFEFDDPPLHDPLAVLWVLRKDLFTTRRCARASQGVAIAARASLVGPRRFRAAQTRVPPYLCSLLRERLPLALCSLRFTQMVRGGRHERQSAHRWADLRRQVGRA